MMTSKARAFTSGLILALAWFSGPAFAASEEDVAALEARVAELEATLQQLIAEQKKANAAAAAAAKPAPAPAPAPAPKADSGSSYSFGGYIKLDAMWSDYSGGDLAPGSAGTQFYIPATVPVGGTPSEGPDLDMQARASRINFKSNHNLNNGAKVTTFLEMDFFLSPGGDERVSNSYNPRLRQAFFTYNNWLFGQTWSTFQDVGALPENLDFVGPAESTTFMRQPLIRYTNGPWEFSAENPETTITPYLGGTRIVSDDGGMPDLVGRYTATLDNGYIKAAAMFRQLAYKNAVVDDTETGLGLSLSGKFMLGEDDVRWMATYGAGTGRYLGLNTANGANLDANNQLHAIDQWGAYVAYRHFWNDLWRSNLTLGYLSNDHDVAISGTGVTSEVYSVHLNLLYSPVDKLTVGGELIYADRTLESNASGDMTRFQFSAKYAF